jgi:hypothetical protein
MNNKSSNKYMEEVFQKLSSPKPVEPDENLFQLINNRLMRQGKINPLWLKATAAILIFIFVAEMMLIKKENLNSTEKELASLLPSTNNILYNEQE